LEVGSGEVTRGLERLEVGGYLSAPYFFTVAEEHFSLWESFKKRFLLFL
jgi:hypothetical protein